MSKRKSIHIASLYAASHCMSELLLVKLISHIMSHDAAYNQLVINNACFLQSKIYLWTCNSPHKMYCEFTFVLLQFFYLTSFSWVIYNKEKVCPGVNSNYLT